MNYQRTRYKMTVIHNVLCYCRQYCVFYVVCVVFSVVTKSVLFRGLLQHVKDGSVLTILRQKTDYFIQLHHLQIA